MNPPFSSSSLFLCVGNLESAMGDDMIVKQQIFAKPIQLADQITKSVDNVQSSFKQDCLKLKSKTEKLASLLRQASQSSSDLYERPTVLLRIIDETEQVLDKSLTLVKKCCRGSNGCLMQRFFTIINIPSTNAFKKMSIHLEILIGDVSWLLGVSVFSDEYMGLSLISQTVLVLCLIREQIDTLRIDDNMLNAAAAAASLVSFLVSDNLRYGTLIIREGGVEPLLKLLIHEEEDEEGQEIAARAIGLLCRYPERVEYLIHVGVCDVFERILKEGTMKVQSMVAWAISELTANYPKCQDHFAQNNIVIPLLVNHLAFEYGDDVLATTKVSMTAMAAKALCRLAKGNSIISRSITECGGLLCLAVLLEKCTDDEVQYNTAMALTQIAEVAEEDTELRLSAFDPNTPGAKAVFDQLSRIIEQADSNNLVPCIMAMGYLARAFQTIETGIIGTLVKLLDNPEPPEICRAAAFALSKFACTGCSLHIDYCKAIINEGGIRNLIQIVYFGEPYVQRQALIVLSYMALHLPDNEKLAQEEILTLLEWTSKQESVIRDPTVQTLLPEAKSKVELYLSAQRYMIH